MVAGHFEMLLLAFFGFNSVLFRFQKICSACVKLGFNVDPVLREFKTCFLA